MLNEKVIIFLILKEVDDECDSIGNLRKMFANIHHPTRDWGDITDHKKTRGQNLLKKYQHRPQKLVILRKCARKWLVNTGSCKRCIYTYISLWSSDDLFFRSNVCSSKWVLFVFSSAAPVQGHWFWQDCMLVHLWCPVSGWESPVLQEHHAEIVGNGKWGFFSIKEINSNK